LLSIPPSGAFGVSTPYMPKTAPELPTDNFKVSAQWTRRMNSLELWLTLKLHGRRAYEQHIDEQMRLAADFADWIGASEYFELSAPMYVPILNFRLRWAASDDELLRQHLELVDLVTRNGRRWISETRVAGRSVLRMMVISYLTGEPQLADLKSALNSRSTSCDCLPPRKRRILRRGQIASREISAASR